MLPEEDHEARQPILGYATLAYGLASIAFPMAYWLCGRRGRRRSNADGWRWSKVKDFWDSVLDDGIDASEKALINEIAAARQGDRLVSDAKLCVMVVFPLIGCGMLFAGKRMLEAEPHDLLRQLHHWWFTFPLQLMFVAAVLCTKRVATNRKYMLALSRSMYVLLICRKWFGLLAPANLIFRRDATNTYSAIGLLWWSITRQDSRFGIGFNILALVVLAFLVPFNERTQSDPVSQWFREAATLSLVSVVGISVERAMKRSIHSELQAKSSQAFEKAADKLLSSMCDAVVHISGDFKILSDCTRLLTLLFIQPKSSYGKKTAMMFSDLIYTDQDRQVFKAFLERHASDFLADTVHISLRDSTGIEVPVQIFHTSCVKCDGQEVHIVGVREVGFDRAVPLSALPSVGDSFLQVRNPVHDVTPNADDDVKSWRSMLSLGSMSSISEYSVETEHGTGVVPTMDSDHSEVEAWVSTCDDSFQILKCTPVFSCLLGQSAVKGRKFINLVKGREAFRMEMQRIVNALLNDNDEAQASKLPIILATAGQGQIRAEAVVDLDVEFDAKSEATTDNEDLTLRIKLVSWQKVKCRRRNGIPRMPSHGCEISSRDDRGLMLREDFLSRNVLKAEPDCRNG
eukprot:CAMPEP_0178369940 /NCGR_PEP_ID=MMETSP0689_2-20121128/38_1 /TAXON_ID=160604 /ORGANISM="Amphidinium massartii, Strain CS-259" /LENGTH=627 /DNA_ID=CAMNT_0019989731 /DNA_START=68 /DNA_END=1947 /DNA_ORIENTATION=+